MNSSYCKTDVFGHELEYSCDAVGNGAFLDLDSSTLTSYAYDNANKLTSRVAPNGVTSSYEYDGMSRLKRLKHYTSGATLYDDQFSYNSANQISQIAGLSQTRNFTYDNINRLTAVTVGLSTVESYTYDAVGNRTASHLSSSYTTGAFNRLTATDTASYSYNANGSMTGKTESSLTWTYTWDRENRMVSAGDGTNTATYQYDALGRRVKRTQSSDVQKYTHDGDDVLLDDINSTLTKYQNGLGIDDKLKSRIGSTSKYFLKNHLGSSVGIANSSGSVTDLNDYATFGIATNSSFPSRYGFTGREIDGLSGLQYSRARFYDSNLGRFVAEDPIGFSGGDINIYGYVRNGPIQRKDPRGLDDGDMNDLPFSNNDKPYDWDNYYDQLKELSIHVDPYQPLSKCSKSWLGKYFPDVDLNSVRVYEGIPWFVPIDADGFTDGTDVYIKKGQYNPGTVKTLGLLGHELTHTRQYQNDGIWSFRRKYAWDAVKNFGYGSDIPYENQAYRNGASIEIDIELRNAQGETPCGCDDRLTTK